MAWVQNGQASLRLHIRSALKMKLVFLCEMICVEEKPCCVPRETSPFADL